MYTERNADMNCYGHSCPTKETCSRKGCQQNAVNAAPKPMMNQGKQMVITSRKTSKKVSV